MNGTGAEDISRRSFLAKLVWFAVASTAAIFAIPIVRYSFPVKGKAGENILTDAEGRPVSGDRIAEGGSFIGLSRDGPTIVIRRGGKLIALSAVCTHLGCLVKWLPNEDVFLCPCHAGKFDANGVNISGPPPSPLPAYSVETNGEGRINLKKI